MTIETRQESVDPWDHPDDLPPVPTQPALRVVPAAIDAAAGALQAWEYLTTHGGTNSKDAVARLNAVGAEGWELVSVIPPHDPSGQTVLFLKRPRTR